MNANLILLIMGFLIALFLFLTLTSKGEGLKLPCAKLYDNNHCPKTCDQFQYPDMYSPKGAVCNDPFSWGYEYSTGRCPHLFTGQDPMVKPLTRCITDYKISTR